MQKVILLLASLVCLAFGASVIGAYLWGHSHYEQAELATRKRDFVAAHTHWVAYLKVHPYDTASHFKAAQAARRAGLFDDAYGHLKDCERQNWPADSIALERVLITAQQGEVAQSEGYLLSCLESDHEDVPLILEALIEGYLHSFKIEMARFCVAKLLERQPDNPQAHLWRGEVFDLMRAMQQAVLEYQRALDLDPDFHEARLRLAEDLIHLNRVGDALPLFRQLRQTQYQERRVQLGLAECLTDEGELEEARDLLDELLPDMPTADPRTLEAYTQRAKVALLLNEPADAKKWSREALAISPNSREALYNLYHSLDLLDQHDEALVVQNRLHVVEDDLRLVEGLINRIRDDPHDPRPRHEIGVIYLRLGQDVEALTWLVSALEEDKRYRPTLVVLADYYEKQGHMDRAREYRRRAALNDPFAKSAPTSPERTP
jgi:tetratricopeptide (TPR) repeat protein